MQFSLAISKFRVPFSNNVLLKIELITFLVFWLYTLIKTTDIYNWILENTLVILFLLFLIITHKKYQFSDLTYLLVFIYLCLHVYGAQYTYAENPFGYWLKEKFEMSRNHYDRIVHFSFGFLLAYPMRELFLKWIKFPTWVSWLLPIEITLSISGLYELIEWAVADIFFKEQGVAYLGTQGDIWDAQKDMFLATIGAIIATLIVSSIKRILRVGYENNN
jgi:putative membrane protein